LIKIVNGPEEQSERARQILSQIARGQAIDFYLALASTAISDLDNISAAGSDALARRLTPKLDAEALVSGRTASGERLPSSPLGVTSPVIITRACLSLFKQYTTIINCGAFVAPQIKHSTSGTVPGKNIAFENALPPQVVARLFEEGKKRAAMRTAKIKSGEIDIDIDSIPVLAECVPGGTTTSLALLQALGYSASGRISGSLPAGSSSSKERLTQDAAARLNRELGPDRLKAISLQDPLFAVSCLGDPMQAFAAGFVLGILQAMDPLSDGGEQPLILAGGCQMLAVYALVKALAASETIKNFAGGQSLSEKIKKSLIVITTKWVAYDPAADTKALAEILEAPYVAASPDFYKSKHAGLRAYEEGHVKEGVGAGAVMALADIFGHDHATILDTIDQFYEDMILTAPIKI